MALLGWSIKLEVADRPMALMELFEQPDDELKKLPPSVYLIDPAYGLVDFSGRDGELDKLRAWCLEAKASPMRLLTGEGGQGKSRVAMQLARVMSDRGWTTGLLRPDATIDEILTLLTGERPKLVVVDDANLHIKYLRTLASRAPLAVDRIRVLALARTGGAWWENLKRGKQSEAPWVFRGAPRELKPVAMNPDTRQAIFSSAFVSLAQFLGIDRQPPTPELFDHGIREGPLLAPASLERARSPCSNRSDGRSPTSDSPVTSRLLEEALEREDVNIGSSPRSARASILTDKMSATERCQSLP